MGGVRSHHLKLATTSQLGQATVELDGQEIQNGLVGVELRVRAGELNAAALELKAPTFEAEGKVSVRLPEETQALLKRLGWTPPEEAT